MQLRFKDVPIRAKPQCLNASVELGAGGMRAQPVKMKFEFCYLIRGGQQIEVVNKN